MGTDLNIIFNNFRKQNYKFRLFKDFIIGFGKYKVSPFAFKADKNSVNSALENHNYF